MWTLAGMAIVIIAAVHSSSYVLWLWDQGERQAAIGAALLSALSVALPVYAVVASNP